MRLPVFKCFVVATVAVASSLFNLSTSIANQDPPPTLPTPPGFASQDASNESVSEDTSSDLYVYVVSKGRRLLQRQLLPEKQVVLRFML